MIPVSYQFFLFAERNREYYMLLYFLFLLILSLVFICKCLSKKMLD